MEARIIALERQLMDMFQVQSMLLKALDIKVPMFQSAGFEVSRLLSSWNGQAVHLSSSVGAVGDNYPQPSTRAIDEKIEETRTDSGKFPGRN